MSRADGEREPVTIRDRRRIDPDTGAVRTQPGHDDAREPGSTGDTAASQGVVEPHDAEPDAVTEGESPDADPVQVELAERIADLQRVSAEYANYRRRVDRDRQVVIDAAKAQVATSLIPVLDDLDRARSHGDLQPPLRSVADKLADALTGQGLLAFGAEGDPFDPALHEAVSHEGSGGAPVLSMVMRPGYRFGERVLRPAMVAVSEGPADEPDAPAGSIGDDVSEPVVPGPDRP